MLKTVAFGFLLATLASAPVSAQSAPGKDTVWITNLKCSDLVNPKDGNAVTENLPSFGMWIRGYMAGISSASMQNLTKHIKYTDFVVIVLQLCAKEPSYSAVEASIDTASFFFNILDTKAKKTANLKSPGVPAREE